MVEEFGQQEPLAEHVYDKRVKEYGWVGSEVAFGLAYEYTSPAQTILDIGIGTGLGSILFHKAGMFIYGLDNSDAMLDICQSNETQHNQTFKWDRLMLRPLWLFEW